MKKMNFSSASLFRSGALGFALSWIVMAMPVAAEVFKWTDEQGNVHYGDQPPGASVKTQTVKIQKSGVVVPPKPADAGKPPTVAEQLATKEENDTICAAAKKNIAALEGNGQVMIKDASGKQTELVGAERAAALGRAKQAAKASCPPGSN